MAATPNPSDRLVTRDLNLIKEFIVQAEVSRGTKLRYQCALIELRT